MPDTELPGQGGGSSKQNVDNACLPPIAGPRPPTNMGVRPPSSLPETVSGGTETWPHSAKDLPIPVYNPSRILTNSNISPSPTKFPMIKKQNSMSCTAFRHETHSVKRTTSLPAEHLRAELCRTPSCPALWSCDLDDQGSDLNSEAATVLNGDLGASIHPYMVRTVGSSSVQLPKIFGQNPQTKRTPSRDFPQKGLTKTPRLATLRNCSSQREASTRTSVSVSKNNNVRAISPFRRSDQASLLLPLKDLGTCFRRAKSRKGLAATGRQASEGASGDSGVSVSQRPSDRSDSSAAHDGSEMGAGEVELEIDDETARDYYPNYPVSREGVVPAEETSDTANTEQNSTLSAEKCREWLEAADEDGRGKEKRASRSKGSFKMPKII